MHACKTIMSTELEDVYYTKKLELKLRQRSMTSFEQKTFTWMKNKVDYLHESLQAPG